MRHWTEGSGFVMFAIALVAALVASSATVQAGAHSWRVSEAFSNADGSVWFVELWEYAGGGVERGISGANIVSIDTANFIDIAANVAGDTSNKFVLFANQDFADLPGAPTPDQIVTGNAFFSFAAGERLRYSISGSTFDLIFPAGGLPTDGVNSFQLVGGVAQNTPTNYAGESGSVNATGGGSGDVTLLMNDLPGPTVELTWGVSCEVSDTVAGVYRGSLASLRTGIYDHASASCDLVSPNTALTESSEDEYFIVVPGGDASEGSYGRRLVGGVFTERPQGTSACKTQSISCP